MTIKAALKWSGGLPLGHLDCDWCGEPAEIWYKMSLRRARQCAAQPLNESVSEGDAYNSFCKKCARRQALGMLRDVVALQIGEKRAQEEYVAILKKHPSV